MKVEGIRIECRCGREACTGKRLTQLHIFAQNDDDIALLEALLAEFQQAATEPIREIDLTLDLDAINRARAAQIRN